jgi:hypothetical protein
MIASVVVYLRAAPPVNVASTQPLVEVAKPDVGTSPMFEYLRAHACGCGREGVRVYASARAGVLKQHVFIARRGGQARHVHREIHRNCRRPCPSAWLRVRSRVRVLVCGCVCACSNLS